MPRLRIAILVLFALAPALAAQQASATCAPALDLREWQAYKARFVATNGRVVDTGNRRISHSEGQGWGMLLAEAYGDRETFDRLWDWTSRSLRRPESALHSWKWVPEAEDPVPDPNNATDGDLLIAWALERAARRWQEPAYAAAARAIAAEIRSALMVSAGGRKVLLPGADGFGDADGVTVNLSYYVFPALDALARLDSAPDWRRVRQDGLDLVDDARFGRWGLPPDWLHLARSGTLSPAPQWPARFGYDAIRIPLYLVWGGYGTPERLAAFRAFWRQFKAEEKRQPSWVGFAGGAAGPYPAAPGFAAVAQLVDALLTGGASEIRLPALSETDDYYSASLVLLAKVAACEGIPKAFKAARGS